MSLYNDLFPFPSPQKEGMYKVRAIIGVDCLQMNKDRLYIMLIYINNLGCSVLGL